MDRNHFSHCKTGRNFYPSSLNNRNEIFRQSLRMNTNTNCINFDKSYIIDNNKLKKKGITDKQIQRIKKIPNQNKNNSFKMDNIKITTLKKNKFFSSKNKRIINQILNSNKNEGRNKSLNIYSDKLCKTTYNFKKCEKRNIARLPLFIRTQTNETNQKIHHCSQKKFYFELNNNIYHNSSPFLNKNDFFNYIYKRLKKGNFEDIEMYIKKYLNEIECKNNEEANDIITKYDYKNLRNNLRELEKYIKETEVDRKTEKIYLNNFISKRVANSLESMRKKENQIFKFNKIITTIGNTK